MIRARSAAATSGVRAVQKYLSVLRPTTGTPRAASAPATSWSRPAQPPSPVRITANSSAVSATTAAAGTSTSGRSRTSGSVTGSGAARAVSFAKVARNWGNQLRSTEKPWPTFGSQTSSAADVPAAKLRVAVGSHTWSASPWNTAHGVVLWVACLNNTPFTICALEFLP